MAVKVAINGFGRIGRLAFRQMFGHEGSEIVAINDLTSPDMLAYLLKYDSTQGNYGRDHEVTSTEDAIVVDGKEIKIYKEANAADLPWGELDVDVVLECRPRPRLTSTPAPRRSSSPLLRATTSPRSSTTSTTRR